MNLSFEPSREQTNSPIKFIASGHDGIEIALTSTGVSISSGSISERLKVKKPLISELGLRESPSLARITMNFAGANTAASMVGVDELPGKTNYFTGSDPTGWRVNVPHYAKVRTSSLYPGVDVIYYGSSAGLEYDLIIAPGADAKAIRMVFDGTQCPYVNAAGDLVLQTASADITLHKPVAYQEFDGVKKEVFSRYIASDTSEVTFEIGTYDSQKPLIIDPEYSYSTFLGGVGDDEGLAVAVDSSGNAYLTGLTRSIDFPVANPIQSGFQGVFVAKLDPKGENLIYSTIIGSPSSPSAGADIAVDSNGNAYVSGYASQDFPTTPGAYNSRPAPRFTVFALKLNSTGSQLMYSTFIGAANDYNLLNSLAIDSQGNAFLTGESGDGFPTTPRAFQTSGIEDVFITKLNSTGTDLVYSALVGGSDSDGGRDITVDELGYAYVTGTTRSTDFPVTNPFQANFGGFLDAFVLKLNPDGSALAFSTYLGGSGGQYYGDMGTAVAVDGFHNVYVGGLTESSDFPVTPSAFQPNRVGLYNAFISKLAAEGDSLIYSTFFGGGAEAVMAMQVDEFGNCYSIGWAFSGTPVTADALQSSPGGTLDVYVAKLNATGTGLIYSSFLGGNDIDDGVDMALDQFGNAYVVGRTESNDFPVTKGVFQRKHRQHPAGFTNYDVFLTKLMLGPPKILGATVKGKKLTVFGGNFDEGAVILLNAESQKTANDEASPDSKLTSKKAGKKIGTGIPVTLQVRNSNGVLSNAIEFIR